MSKLGELIQQYCPDGVELKLLGEVCDIHKGVQFNKSDMQDEGTYPVINGGINPSGYVEVFNEEENTITISQGGASAGYVNFLLSKFWLGAHCYAVKPTNEVKNRYLYHFIKQNEITLQQCQYGAGIPALAKGTITSLEIPIPPLPVQEEIVRVLDTFTELQAELQAELQKRLQQYNYYRDNLLSFEGRSDVEWKKLGEICDVRRGIRVVKQQLKDNGDYPVFQNSIPPMGFYDKYNREGNMPYIICAGSSSGSVGYCYSPFWAADDCFTVESGLNNRYAFHVLKQSNHKLFNQVRNGSMPRLPHTAIDDLIVPVPSLEEQEIIASTLDRFEALTTDLSQGLPAEIEKRRHQYEYYRDKLLTFKRK